MEIEIETEHNENTVAELTYDEKIQFVNEIAEPLAPRKLTKKCYKLVKKASKAKQLRIGKKEVERRLRKNEKGLVVFAGNVQPIDIMSHLPIVCEDNSIPYVFVPCKRDLGAAVGVKRAVLMVLIQRNDDYADLYDELHQKVSDLNLNARVSF